MAPLYQNQAPNSINCLRSGTTLIEDRPKNLKMQPHRAAHRRNRSERDVVTRHKRGVTPNRANAQTSSCQVDSFRKHLGYATGFVKYAGQVLQVGLA
jgi:hypothetical protein